MSRVGETFASVDAGWMQKAAGPVAIALAALALMAPALWNGSVLFYWDSVDYVYLPFTEDLPVYRTMPYGLFAGLGRLTGSLWAVVAVQAVLVAYVLHETLAVFAPRPTWRILLPLVLLLCGLTALPWRAGQLMPDVFAGLVVLGIAALAFGGARLSLRRRLPLAVIVVLAVSVHTSHIGVGVGLVVALAGVGWLTRRLWPELKPRLGLAAASVAMGVMLIAGVHWVTVGRPFIAQPASVLLLARLVQDGIAKRFLDDHCQKGSPFRLCKFRNLLPKTANEFLWGGGAVAQRLGGWAAMEGEASTILTESLEEYPLLHVEAAARLTVEQATMFRTGDGIVRDVGWLIGDTLRRYYPAAYLAFKTSHQNEGIDFDEVNDLQVPVQAVAQLLLPLAAVVAWRRRDRLAFGLMTVILLALLGNAFICGALSNPNDRYQNRIAWLAVTAVMVSVVRFRDRRLTLRAAAERSPGDAGPLRKAPAS